MTETRLPTAAEDAAHEPATAAAKAVAGFLDRLGAIDELLAVCETAAASEPTVRLVHHLRGNVIAQALFALTQRAEGAQRHADGAPDDIDAKITYDRHRAAAVVELAELLEVIGRAAECPIEFRLLGNKRSEA